MGAAPMVLQVAGAGLQIYGQLQAGAAEAEAHKYNARIAKQNAAISLDQAARDAEAQQRAASKIIGGVRASYGASGVSGGSVMDVIADSATTAELDRQNILYDGNLKAMGFMNEAALEKAAAKQAITGSRLGAASTLLTTAGKVAGSSPAAPAAT